MNFLEKGILIVLNFKVFLVNEYFYYRVIRRSGSKLQVRRLREEDSGSYQCQAMNVVGQSEPRSVDVVVIPGQWIDHGCWLTNYNFWCSSHLLSSRRLKKTWAVNAPSWQRIFRFRQAISFFVSLHCYYSGFLDEFNGKTIAKREK